MEQMEVLNFSENTTSFIGDIRNFIVLNSVLTPLYLLFVIVPSLLTNGVILLLFAKKKDLRSPINLLTVNHCFSGIFGNLLNGFLTLVAYPISLSYGSCTIETIIVGTTLLTTFGISTLNLAAISVGIYVTLKYNNTAHRLTYRKVVIVIAVVWTYSALWAIVLAIIVRDLRSLRCLLYTDTYELINSGDSFNLQTGTLYQIVLFVTRDLVVDMVSRALVVIFTVASYRLFRKHSINPPEGLTRRMLLLPVLTTIMSTIVNFFSGVLLITVNNGYGAVSVSLENYEHSPLFYIQTIFQFLVEYNAIAYACLFIYLNNGIRMAYKDAINFIKTLQKATVTWRRCQKQNRVVPQ